MMGVGVGMVAVPAEAGLATKKEMPEFLGDFSWHQTEPLTKAGLEGKVVLAAFWNYSCAACLRDLPYLRFWSEAYRENGFLVLGIHTPDYSFENDVLQLEAAVQKWRIPYPVVMDPDQILWNLYHNLDRPAYHLIDSRGRIRSSLYGEKSRSELEPLIRDLLQEKGEVLEPQAAPLETAADPSRIHSGRILFGYEKVSRFGNSKKLKLDAVIRFEEPKTILPDRFYLAGNWEIQKDFFRLATAPGSLIVRYDANGVHLIAGSRHNIPRRARVSLNGSPLFESNRGLDVYLKEGESLMSLEKYRLYQLVNRGEEYGDDTVRIDFEEPGIEIYGVEFGRIFPPPKREEEQDPR